MLRAQGGTATASPIDGNVPFQLCTATDISIRLPIASERIAARCLRAVGLLCALGLLVAGCQRGSERDARTATAAPEVVDPAAFPEGSGARLARVHCQGCHQFPAPHSLSRMLWERSVLPQMLSFVFSARPDANGITVTEWEKIKAYYLENAPAEPPPQPEHPEIETGLAQFAVRTPGSFRSSPPLTSVVHFDSAGSRLYVGDVKAEQSTLSVLDGRARLVSQVAPFQAPVRVQASGDTLRVLEIGSLRPTDERSGRLVELRKDPNAEGYGAPRVLIDSLQRPVDVAWADLNADGRADAVISEFGYREGRLAWFEQKEGGHYRRHVLRGVPGAVRHCVRDLDGDGRPDVIALFGQGDEGVYAFYNQGAGRFRQERVLRFPPTYGSTYFELVDFDKDGHLDILYTSGDNGDYAPVMRGYHGVRLFTGDGAGAFEEAFFFPLNGAYQAAAEDFDQDGDYDIAAISFYPDYEGSPEESFVYLKNEGRDEAGDYLFAPSTFERSAQMGRWLVFDRGDLDADGDVDLVLGSLVGLPQQNSYDQQSGYVPAALQQQWVDEGPQLVILENTLQ